MQPAIICEADYYYEGKYTTEYGFHQVKNSDNHRLSSGKGIITYTLYLTALLLVFGGMFFVRNCLSREFKGI